MIEGIFGFDGSGKGVRLAHKMMELLNEGIYDVICAVDVHHERFYKYAETICGKPIRDRIFFLEKHQIVDFWRFRGLVLPLSELNRDAYGTCPVMDERGRWIERPLIPNERLLLPAMVDKNYEMGEMPRTDLYSYARPCFYLIDEAHKYFNKAAASKRGLVWRHYWGEHRHWRDHFWYADQVSLHIEEDLLQRTRKWHLMRNFRKEKFGNLFSSLGYIEERVYNHRPRNSSLLNEKHESYKYGIDPALLNCFPSNDERYDSYADLEHKEKAKGIPIKWAISAALLLFAAFGLAAAFSPKFLAKLYTGWSSKDLKAAVTAAPAAPAPAVFPAAGPVQAARNFELTPDQLRQIIQPEKKSGRTLSDAWDWSMQTETIETGTNVKPLRDDFLKPTPTSKTQKIYVVTNPDPRGYLNDEAHRWYREKLEQGLREKLERNKPYAAEK